jgi:DNA repair exonuclease SbcCD nuclease subunit
VKITIYKNVLTACALTVCAFTLNATPAFAAPWKFAVLCDSRAGYANDPTPIVGPDGTVYNSATSSPYYDATYGISPYFKNVASALAKETGIDFVLYPGDLARGKKPVPSDTQMDADFKEWLNQWNPVASAGIPTYYVRGNHDTPNATTATTIWTNNILVPGNSVNPVTMDASQTGLSYSFTHKGSLFVGLDEYPNGTGATGYDSTFLKSQLARQAQHKFVFAHQPLWNYKASELGPVGLADDINNGGADLYFSGHVHSYQRIAEQGYNFQEMIIGTGGAPQDNPTTGPSDVVNYTADPKLTVKSYAGGAGTNAKFGYAIVTVNDDGSVTTEMKFLADPASASSTVSSFDTNVIPPKPWKFGVMADTQWTATADPNNANPNHVPVSIINQINQQFINQGVKFVIQPGDLTENGADADIAVRAAAAQTLYSAGIGFFPIRGNHETYTAGNSYGIPAVLANFPQTQCLSNTFGATNCTSPALPAPYTDDLKGMSYSFDFGTAGSTARFVMIDEWVTPNKSVSAAGYPYGWSIAEQQGWINSSLDKNTRGTDHAFVISHQNLIGENHQDSLFQGYTNANPAMQNDYLASLQNNNVKYHISGHDHVHQRSSIVSPDGLSKVQGIINSSNSSKFYTPKAVTDANWFGQKTRETSLSQELYTVGYYIYTVDGPRVTVDFYSDNHGGWQSDNNYPLASVDSTNYPLNVTPAFNFVKKETWGYSTNGKEFLVGQGGTYTTVQDTYNATTAKILNGTNGSTKKDYTNRQLTKNVDTGWTTKGTDTISDVLSIWGMTDLGAASTDTFALSVSYDPSVVVNTSSINAGQVVALSTKDVNGNWVNAVDKNAGGRKRFILGAFNKAYPLGTYGVDPVAHTAWAVVNSTGSGQFAVVQK